MLTLCALIPLLHGCVASAAGTSAKLPPPPAMPNAVITETHICIPHAEAGELLLWIENVEKAR